MRTLSEPLALHALRRFELAFYRDLADVVERPYGLFYHARDNPLSHDSNHAVITDPDAQPDLAIGEVTRFYQRMDITPRLYPAFLPGELARLEPALALAGYSVRVIPWRLFVWAGTQPAGDSRPSTPLEVRTVEALDDALASLVNSDGEVPWTVLALRRHLRAPGFHLLAGYVEGIPVTMASLKVMDGLARVDDVLTHPAHRRRGYARALMAALLEHLQGVTAGEPEPCRLYLYAEDPTAIRIYQDVGFVEQPLPEAIWEAWKPLPSHQPARRF